MNDVGKKYSTIHYKNYLGLEKVLTAQHPRSAELEREPAHEEMLFIIVHQSYELWFKQIIHELESVIKMFQKDEVDERKIGIAVGRLDRVKEIINLLIEHIGIMETMTSLDFLDFRNYLFPASGFQSYQFRKIENLLGLPDHQRMTYGGHHYGKFFSEEENQELSEIASEKNLFLFMEDWLERTPFLRIRDFKFLDLYKKAVENMIAKEAEAIKQSEYLTEK